MPISQHGVLRCVPPPRAPECPFSGLSLTTPRSCPTLALGLAFGSSVTPSPSPELGPGPGVPQIPPIPHLQGQRRVCPPSGKRPQLGLPWGNQEWLGGPPGAPHPSSNPLRLVSLPWGLGDCRVLGRELLCNTSSRVLCARAALLVRGQQRGAGPLPGPVQACSGVSGAGTGHAPWPQNRGRDRLSRLVSFFNHH